jgi:hypothetical protein
MFHTGRFGDSWAALTAKFVYPFAQVDFLPFDPTIKRTEGTLRGPDGKVFKTTKGAPQVILKLCHNKDEIQNEVDSIVHELGTRGIRSLAVAKSEGETEDKWVMQGILTFLDPPRPDTKSTIERSMELGVDVKMITGDHVCCWLTACIDIGHWALLFMSVRVDVPRNRDSFLTPLSPLCAGRHCQGDGAHAWYGHKHQGVARPSHAWRRGQGAGAERRAYRIYSRG